MTEDEALQALRTDLVSAGRSLVIEPVPDDLTERVLAAVQAAPSRSSQHRAATWWRWLRARRRRLVAAIVAAVLVALTLTPPVRAAVIEWLRIGGVVVKTGARPVGTPIPAPPSAGQPVTLQQASAAVDFPIGVPARLGDPERVTVSTDRRVVGMDWTLDGNPVHLDQLDGTVSWAFLKQTWEQVTPTDVAGRDAAWLADPHEIVYVDRDGVEHRETARISGPSLIWQQTLGGRQVTLRLEGVRELATARAIAETLGLR